MLARLNLTAVLAALAVVDLVLDRILRRLFLPSAAVASPLERMLVQGGSFVSYLAGALGICLFATGLFGALRRRELFAPSTRFVVAILAIFFVGLGALSLSMYHLPERIFVQLTTSYGFLAWTIGLAVWRSPVGLRPKLGASLFVLPALLHTVALFSAEMGWHFAFFTPANVARAGEILALSAGATAPFLLCQTVPRGRAALAVWVAGALCAGVLLAAAASDPDSVQLVAEYGLRLEIPPADTGVGWFYTALLALSLLGTVTAALFGAVTGGSERLLACAVVLVATSGYQITSPPDLATAAAGLLALGLGLARRSQGADGLSEAAGADGSPEPVPAAP